MRSRVPLAMLVGFALSIALRLWWIGREAVRVHYGHDLLAYAQFIARWDQIARGVEWSAALLLAAGWAELARRARGRTRVLLSLVVLASWCVIAGHVTWNLVEMLVDDTARWPRWFNIISLAMSAIYIAQAVLLAIATSAWRQARWAAVVVLAAAIAAQVPFGNDAASTYLFLEHGLATSVGLALFHAGYIAGVCVIAARFADAHPRLTPPLAEARAGFALGGTAMWLRLVVAVGVLQYARATSEWAWAPVSIAVHGLTLLALAWGALRAARDEVPGRVRLVLAGALGAWWVGVQTENALLARLIAAYGVGEHDADPLVLVGPLIGFASMVLVVSAAASIATARGDIVLRKLLLWLGGAMTAFVLASVWIGARDESRPSHLVLASLIGMLGIGCVAYACHETAKSLGREHPVPAARVVS